MSAQLSELRDTHRASARYTLRVSQPGRESRVIDRDLEYSAARAIADDFNQQQNGFFRPICILELQKGQTQA